jgi:hypothetical protein
MRILPYRTVHNVIDGVVITFTDVTRLKEAEERAKEAEQRALEAKTYAENIVQTVREPLLVLMRICVCTQRTNRSTRPFGSRQRKPRAEFCTNLATGSGTSQTYAAY